MRGFIGVSSIAALAAAFQTFPQSPDDFISRLVAAAVERTTHAVRYDGSYCPIPYPNGDVSPETGVCTDEIIRIYRAIGIDLQQLVYEDIKSDFQAYPQLWGLPRPDPNIDHRRVPNLQRFFERHGDRLELSGNSADYRPGEMVTWTLPNNLPHIGMITDLRSHDDERPLIVHNIGRGPKLEDMLFEFEITGHYRYPRDAENVQP